MEIKGIIPPIVTPFDRDGNVDLRLAEKEIRIAVEAGVDGISIGGSTGEGSVLSDDELKALLEIALDCRKPGQSVVCGIIRNCTRDAVRAGIMAREVGADAVMVTPTSYNVLVPDEEGVISYYSEISAAVDLPVIIYNVVPQNTVTPEMFVRLLHETENVRMVKQSVGGVEALYKMVRASRGIGKVFAATDDMLCTCFSLGAEGSISAILSVFPEECVRMWKLFRNNNLSEAMVIQEKLFNTWQSINGNQFPIRLKYALQLLGREPGYCRSPLTHLRDDDKVKIERAISEIKG